MTVKTVEMSLWQHKEKFSHQLGEINLGHLFCIVHYKFQKKFVF